MKKKLFVMLAAMIFMTGCSGSKGGSSPEHEKNEPAEKTSGEKAFSSDFDIEITEKGLDILKKGELLQQIPIDSVDLYPAYQKSGNAYDFVIINDLNFDGYDDLSVVAVVGEDTNIYQYFLYDPDSSQFVDCETMNALYYLAVPDPESKTISVESWNGSAAAYNSVYHWQDERLMPVSAQSRYIQDNETYIDYFEYDQDGVETLVKRERLITDSSGVPTGEREEVSIELQE